MTARWVSVAAVGIVVVTLLNGTMTYLRRVGLVDAGRYEAAWSVACGNRGTTDAPFGLGRRCAPLPDGSPSPLVPIAVRGVAMEYVYRVSGWEFALKLPKDLLLAALAVAGVFAWRGGAPELATTHRLLLGVAILVGLLAVMAFARGDWTNGLSGLRSFLFLPVALGCGSLATGDPLRSLGKATTLLLGAQLALMPAELLRGLPLTRALPFGGLPGRMAGTLVMPNSLGVLAAVGLVFVLCFVPNRRWRGAAWIFSTLLVALSGSATGWVILALLGVIIAGRAMRVPAPVQMAMVIAGVASSVWLIPRLVNRPELSESFLARVSGVRTLVSGRTMGVLLGEGLGAGSNTLVSLNIHNAAATGMPKPGDPGPGDSLLVSILRQTGVVGVVLLYSAVVLAAVRNRDSRPFLLAIVACSTVSNISELFPVNLLLGLVSARRTPPA